MKRTERGSRCSPSSISSSGQPKGFGVGCVLNDTYRVISSSITQVLRELEATVEPFLLTMSRTTWTILESVSGQQAHVIEMVAAVDSFVEVTKLQLEQKKYLRNFSDKAATFVFPTLLCNFLNMATDYSSQNLPMRWLKADP
jgi:hypothetical protein